METILTRFKSLKSAILVQAIVACLAVNSMADHGELVIVGGGGTPDDVVVEAIRLAGGPTSSILILPQASAREKRGASSADMFRSSGAKDVNVLEFDDPAKARDAIASADLIWFPGGQQSQLIKALIEAGVADAIRRRNAAGAVVGGTSAGAAVMSLDMIPNAPKEQILKAGNTPMMNGLGLVPELIVDQHFVRRQRMNRLLGAVIDHPNRVGVGIGEETAIVWKNKSFSVMGNGSVIVIDGRNADVTIKPKSKLQNARNLQIHALTAGDRFAL